MLLERLDIDAYGPFGKKTLGAFSNGINAIWGPEGSGKTAVIDFIRGVMLGSEYARHTAAVGRVTWADHRGLYHCQRESDGTYNGRMTTDFSPRDAAHADERYRHYGYHSRRPEAIPPALVDYVVAPDSRETSIAKIFEAAATVGFQQATLATKPTTEIERIQQRIVDLDAQLNRDYRGTENRDDLEMRRRRLTTELETLERDAAPVDSTIGTRDRLQIEERLRIARDEADRLRYIEEDLRQSITDIQDEIDHVRDVPQQEPHRWTIAENYRVELEDLDAQLLRWRRTMQEIRSLRERLELSVDDHRYDERRYRDTTSNYGRPHYETDDYLRGLEGRIEHAQRQIDALAGCYTGGYYRSGADAEALTRNLQSLREELNRVREGVVRNDRSDVRNHFGDECAQLRRCEQELMSAIEGLIARRSELMRLASRDHNVPMDQLSSAYGDWHPYPQTHSVGTGRPVDNSHLDAWLFSDNCPPRVHDSEAASSRRQRLQDELAELRLELGRTEDRLVDVVRQVDDLQRELAAVPVARRPIVDTDRMAQLRADLADVRRRLEWLDSLEGLRRERTRLAEELRRLEAEGVRTETPLTACANHWLTRLTAGRLRSVQLAGPEQVRVDGRLESDISTDDRRVASLALRLAVCCLMNENRTGIPIVIDDPVVNHHDHKSIARTLTEFAAGGNQVVVLTRSQALVDDLSDQGAWTDALPARVAVAGQSNSDMYDVNRYLDMAWRETNGLYDNPAEGVKTGWNPSYNYPRKRSMRGYYEPKHREAARGNYSSEDGPVNGTPFYLTPESNVDLAPSIDAVAAARLRGIGVESVGDLLTSNAENIAQRVGLAGVNGNTIRRWQIEADLVCRVPGLRAFDARVLVGCGVTRPEHLSQLHPTELLEKVEAFLATDLGRETLRSGTSYELSRLTTWIASASRAVLQGRRSSNYVTRAATGNGTGGRAMRTRRTRRSSGGSVLSAQRGSYSTDRDYEYEDDEGSSIVRKTNSDGSYTYSKSIDVDGDGVPDETVEYEYDADGNRRRTVKRTSFGSRSSAESLGDGHGSGYRSGSSRSGRSTGSSRSSRSSRSTGSSRSSRSSGSGERSRRSGRSNREYESRGDRSPRERTYTRGERTERDSSRDVVSMTSEPSERPLRFYLTYDAPVVDAPSIGNRMAERLEAIGVITVRDLLEADPDSVAELLEHRRVTADVVSAWQSQSELMCTVPMLRGHDAQILVAAQITEAEELASYDATSLLSIVDPISNSKEGERMLRGAQKPDLEEVTDWINWAVKRDSVQAA